MDPKLLLQQCKIYQNRDREVIFIPYAHVYNFYFTLDELVIKGRRINITFPHEKITSDSFLLDRIISCENGYEFLVKLTEPQGELTGLFAKKSLGRIRRKLNQYKCDKSLYYSYEIRYVYDDDYQQFFISLEPKGQGLKSQSFEIDLDEL